MSAHFASSSAAVAAASSAEDTGVGAGSPVVVGTGVAPIVTTVVPTTVTTRGDADVVDGQDDVADGVAGSGVRSGGAGTTMTETTWEAVPVYVPGATVR